MEEDKKKLSQDADALYAAAAEASRDDTGANSITFSQERLLELSGLPDMKQLIQLVQHLTNQNLFRTLTVKGKLVWNPRPREAARKMLSLDQSDKQIYSAIEESHVNGIWTRAIRNKTNVAQNAVTKSLNKLEKMNMIKSIKSVKNPVQKTYILSNLVPSEDITGNSFFDAGDLDESFRDELMNLIVFWVRNEAWRDMRRQIKRERDPVDLTGDGEASKSPDSKRKRNRVDDVEEADQALRSKRRSKQDQLAYRVGHHDYPTVESIHSFLVNSPAILPIKATSLTVQEIQGCIDVLVCDEKLERIQNQDTWGYRTVRGVTSKPARTLDEDEHVQGTGLTQAPCGRCPVFELCHGDGPINPAGCVYYDQWLME